jgi:hypothetical protein
MAQLATRETSFNVIEIAGLVMSQKSLLDKVSFAHFGLADGLGELSISLPCRERLPQHAQRISLHSLADPLNNRNNLTPS